MEMRYPCERGEGGTGFDLLLMLIYSSGQDSFFDFRRLIVLCVVLNFGDDEGCTVDDDDGWYSRMDKWRWNG